MTRMKGSYLPTKQLQQIDKLSLTNASQHPQEKCAAPRQEDLGFFESMREKASCLASYPLKAKARPLFGCGYYRHIIDDGVDDPLLPISSRQTSPDRLHLSLSSRLLTSHLTDLSPPPSPHRSTNSHHKTTLFHPLYQSVWILIGKRFAPGTALSENKAREAVRRGDAPAAFISHGVSVRPVVAL